MVLSRTDENELLTALHSGVFQAEPWALFLARLRARTDADRCILFIRAGPDAGWTEVDSVQMRGVAGPVPAPPDFDTLRPGRVYADDEMTVDRAGDRPGDGPGHARHLRITWPGGGGELALSLHRVKADFRARDASLLASLAPHLTIALRAHVEIDGARRRSALAEAALADFALGWVLLDSRGRVADTDPAAARLIEEGRVMRRAADGRLRCAYPEAESLIEQAVAHPVAPPRAAWLNVAPPVQMVAMRAPVPGRATLAAPHCLLLFRALRGGALADGRYLPDLFRLTRGEAALAARIADGDSLSEAADHLGLTIETTRNYSKRIYFKTGARGQGDLVRILLNGVGMLG